MSNQIVSTFEGKGSWTEDDDDQQALHMVCKVRSTANIILEIISGQGKYEAWLMEVETELYAGVYEMRKGGKVLRDRISCSLKRTDHGMHLEGTLHENFRDRDWDAELQEV